MVLSVIEIPLELSSEIILVIFLFMLEREWLEASEKLEQEK